MVKTTDCGSVMRGFESHHPPHFLGAMLENLRSKHYYKIIGIASWVLVPPAFWLLAWARGPRGFASLAGLFSVSFAIWLAGIYIALFINAYIDRKETPEQSTNLFIDLGYILGFAFIIYTFLF